MQHIPFTTPLPPPPQHLPVTLWFGLLVCVLALLQQTCWQPTARNDAAVPFCLRNDVCWLPLATPLRTRCVLQRALRAYRFCHTIPPAGAYFRGNLPLPRIWFCRDVISGYRLLPAAVSVQHNATAYLLVRLCSSPLDRSSMRALQRARRRARLSGFGTFNAAARWARCGYALHCTCLPLPRFTCRLLAYSMDGLWFVHRWFVVGSWYTAAVPCWLPPCCRFQTAPPAAYC